MQYTTFVDEDLARGHVLVCLLAYYMEWHLRKLAPVLFEKQDRGAARKAAVLPCQFGIRIEGT